MIYINEPNYSWNGSLRIRSRTDMIVLHHAAASSCTAAEIDDWHQKRGWAGIGYHFLVRKDGSIFRGRPENRVGAHAGAENDCNTHSIGICFEGNYSVERTMPIPQILAGQELISYLFDRYGAMEIRLHRELTATDCPGMYFPSKKFMKKDILDMTEKELTELIDRRVKELLNPSGEPSEALRSEWRKAKSAGITDGSRPLACATREQVAAMVVRANAL